MPKVSIVTSVYNRAEYLSASINSLLNQDYDDFEVVVIDDGSQDHTLEVLKSFKHKHLKIITQENTGFTRAIRAAIESTKGQYIAIVDGADICYPNRIRVQANYLDSHPNVGVVGSHVELLEERNGLRRTVRLSAGSNPAEELLERSLLWHSEVMFRKDVYEKVGGYRPVFYYSQDNDLWLRMTEVSDLAIIPEVLHTIIKFENGISTTPQKLALARCYRALAVYCARERRAGRIDPVEKFGVNALLLRPRSATLSKRLAHDGFKNVMRGNSDVGLWLVNFALQEKWTIPTIVYYLLAHIPCLHTMRNFAVQFKKPV